MPLSSPLPIYFRRGDGGALAYVDLAAERVQGIAETLLDLLNQEGVLGRYFSRRDLLYSNEAKSIVDAIKEGSRVQPCARPKACS